MRSQRNERYFLFSVDLEDVRFRLPDRGKGFAARVPHAVETYLKFLSDIGAHATFFTVGDVAREHPELIRLIEGEGHELGCHSASHLPLKAHTPESFKADLVSNLEALSNAGGRGQVIGFRAPYFSLTENCAWAYPVLKDLGFVYSSSVLPAKNPLYGWEGFGESAKLQQGVLEIPITLGSLGPMRIPFAGGTYFRAFPRFLLKRMFARHAGQNLPVLSYFHPYDVDHEQERFKFPELGDSHFYQFLMYYNRAGMLDKLKMLVTELGFKVITYAQWIQCRSLTESGSRAAEPAR